MSNEQILDVTLDNGTTLPFRSYTSGAGNQCFGILDSRKDGSRYFSKYGVNVAAEVVGDHSQVSSVKVLDQTFPVTSAVEAKKDKKGNPLAGTERTVLRSSGKVRLNGTEKEFSLRISVTGEDRYNVSGSINGKRGGGGKPVATSL